MNESGRVPRNAVLFQEAGQRTFVASWFVVCWGGTVQNRFTFQRGTEHSRIGPNVRGQPPCPVDGAPMMGDEDEGKKGYLSVNIKRHVAITVSRITHAQLKSVAFFFQGHSFPRLVGSHLLIIPSKALSVYSPSVP